MHDDGADPPEYQHGDEPNLETHRAALEAWGEYAYLNNARMGAAA
jgi:hypothetical protein